MGSHSELYEY